MGAKQMEAAKHGQTADQAVIVDAAILFTDLTGSSALYRQIGDAGAYSIIRRHFDLLSEIIADCQGMLVKTIGDAVMAAFPARHMAVRAALAAQASIAAFSRESLGDDRMTIKLGVHAGPVLAVLQENRQDYFGKVVNIAAQLRDVSRDGDLVISLELAGDPQVQTLLAGRKLVQGRIALKGSTLIQPVAHIGLCLRIAAGADRAERCQFQIPA